ncbi:MAG: hypothetical protein II358_06195, partial [Tidjanibacter sp.]|nr:hypothetical protein [Tidjanibacter sp.]
AAEDTATWSEKRYVYTDTPGGWTVIPASIPTVLLDWDQAAADAFTASGVLPDLSQPEEGGEHEGFN